MAAVLDLRHSLSRSSTTNCLVLFSGHNDTSDPCVRKPLKVPSTENKTGTACPACMSSYFTISGVYELHIATVAKEEAPAALGVHRLQSHPIKESSPNWFPPSTMAWDRAVRGSFFCVGDRNREWLDWDGFKLCISIRFSSQWKLIKDFPFSRSVKSLEEEANSSSKGGKSTH